MTIIVCVNSASSADLTGTVGIGSEFSSTDSGPGFSIGTLYLPLTVTLYPTDSVDVSLEIPFLYQHGGVASVIGSQGLHGGGMESGKTVASPSSASQHSLLSSPGMFTGYAAGLGDITVKVGYMLAPEERWNMGIRPTFYLKFPTADSTKGLGTGKYDEGVSVQLSKTVENWHAFVEPGYTVQGREAGMALKNYFSYRAGVGYQATASLLPWLVVKGTTPLAEGLDPVMEVRLAAQYSLNEKSWLEGYVAKGVTAATSEYGFGLSLTRGF